MNLGQIRQNLDSSNLALSRAQKICRWLGFVLFAGYFVLIKIYAGAFLPDFWLDILGIIALVLYVRMQTFRVGVLFGYAFFVCLGALVIAFLQGAFDESVLNETLASIAKAQNGGAHAISMTMNLATNALIFLALVGFGLSLVRKFTQKIPSIFLGFLLLAPLVCVASKPLYAVFNANEYEKKAENSQDEFEKSEFVDWQKIQQASKPVRKELIDSMPKSPKGFKYFPQDEIQLKELVEDFSVDLGDIDTSLIVSMRALFEESLRPSYAGLDKWDTSNVRDMSFMFRKAVHFDDTIPFIDEWDTSKVEFMDFMFAGVGGGQLNIDKWDTSNALSMQGMFYEARHFNSPIGEWNVSKVGNMKEMFLRAESFEGDLSEWELNASCDTTDMFYGSALEKTPPLWYVNAKKGSEN